MVGCQHLSSQDRIHDVHDDAEDDDTGYEIPDNDRQLLKEKREDLNQHYRIETQVGNAVQFGTEIRYQTHLSGQKAIDRIGKTAYRIDHDESRTHRLDEYQGDGCH